MGGGGGGGGGGGEGEGDKKALPGFPLKGKPSIRVLYGACNESSPVILH